MGTPNQIQDISENGVSDKYDAKRDPDVVGAVSKIVPADEVESSKYVHPILRDAYRRRDERKDILLLKEEDVSLVEKIKEQLTPGVPSYLTALRVPDASDIDKGEVVVADAARCVEPVPRSWEADL